MTMAKHRHKKPRINVFFRNKGHLFKLLEAINFGSKSSPELKIKGLSETYMQIRDDKKRFDGKLHEGQIISFVDGKHLEFTYHKDGSILVEIIHPSGEKDHSNPYGEGDRWTPIVDIKTFQPIMIFLISSLTSYYSTFYCCPIKIGIDKYSFETAFKQANLVFTSKSNPSYVGKSSNC